MLIENGEIWNNDSSRNYVERAKLRTPQAKRENRFDYFSIEVKGDVAWVSYHNYPHSLPKTRLQEKSIGWKRSLRSKPIAAGASGFCIIRPGKIIF